MLEVGGWQAERRNMGQVVYDVYDKDGNLIIEKMTSAEIGAALNESPVSIARHANSDKLLKERYGIVKAGERKGWNSDTERIIRKEWEKVTAPFRKVIWVKQYAPGVRKLGKGA